LRFKIFHEANHSLCIAQGKRTTVTELLDQRAIAHRFKTEAGRAYVMLGDEGLDLVEEGLVCEQRVHDAAFYDKFPTAQALMLEIYQMAGSRPPCDIFPMVANREKKAEAERRAREIYERLMRIRPEGMSNNQWTAKAGVSTSFFTNMQGGSKPASEPSIGNLRLVLNAVGASLPEFFLQEAQGRLMHRPTRQELEQALADVWEGLPSGSPDRQIAYVAQALLPALGLPEPAVSIENGGSSDGEVGHEADVQAHPATN
jgi:hypothetical protein